MSDQTTTTQRWQIHLFAVGVWVLGWGVTIAIPQRWRRIAIILMLLATPAMVLAVMITSQGIPE